MSSIFGEQSLAENDDLKATEFKVNSFFYSHFTLQAYNFKVDLWLLIWSAHLHRVTDAWAESGRGDYVSPL